MSAWLFAFIITQVVEVPIWYWGGRKDIPSKGKNLLCAFGASTITHPILWFAFPWGSGPYWLVFLLGETFVIVVESFWAKSMGVSRPWRLSLIANICSIVIGFLLQTVFY